MTSLQRPGEVNLGTSLRSRGSGRTSPRTRAGHFVRNLGCFLMFATVYLAIELGAQWLGDKLVAVSRWWHL